MKHSLSRHTVPRKTFNVTDALFLQHEERLENYIEQLLWWNQKINLVSRGVSRETVREHVHHSLLLSQFEAFKKADTIVDAGTGGGLPGIPLAITSPGKSFLLNDIVTKKIMAVKQMAQKLRLPHLQTSDVSIKKVKKPTPYLLISKHAFKIDELVNLVNGQPWTHLIFYKGLDFEKELAPITLPLTVSVYDLSKHAKNSFYQNKGIIVITK